MPEFHDSAAMRVNARPNAVLNLITDIDRLPEWNKCIEHIVDKPPSLETGSEWAVTMHVPGMPRWTSRSRVIELDPAGGLFKYQSQTDDGNPSVAIWTWQVRAADGGSEVTIHLEIQPKTFWRNVLFSRIRRRQLAKEVPASLEALAAAVRQPA